LEPVMIWFVVRFHVPLQNNVNDNSSRGPAARTKPTLKEVGYLAQINKDCLNDPKALREFWRLRVKPNEIALIEADLAEHVPQALRCILVVRFGL
jgi:hypothetical protein